MKIRILIVDDEREIRDMLARHFSFVGFETDVAENGVRALDMFAEQKWDILISDILMPEMGGIELLRRVNHEYPMTHAIMISGYVSLDNALACMRLGADTIIFKPLNETAQLDAAVERAVSMTKDWLGLLRGLKDVKEEEVTR